MLLRRGQFHVMYRIAPIYGLKHLIF